MKPRHDGFLASRRKKNDRLNEVGKQHESINNSQTHQSTRFYNHVLNVTKHYNAFSFISDDSKTL
jgi:hypothetical protein